MTDEIRTPSLLYVQTLNLSDGFLSTENIDECILSALRRYSSDLPKDIFGIIDGDGTSVYDVSAASIVGWVENDSFISRVFAPWSLDNANEIENNKWSTEEDPTTGKNIVLKEIAPAVGDSIRIQFSGEWAENTVPARHISSVAKLAAASMCRMLASRAAQQGESTIGADTFSSTTEAEQWRSLARDFESQYKAGIGLGSDSGTDVEGASVEFQLDPDSNQGLGKLSGYPGD